MAFNNASHFTFTGQAINTVLGDQVVHIGSRDVEPTEYDEVWALAVVYIQGLKVKMIV